MRPISFRSIFWVNGTDGAQLGLIRPITRMNSMYSPTSTRPGTIAPRNMSPAEVEITENSDGMDSSPVADL